MPKVDVGSYRAKPVNWGGGESTNKKTPYVFIDFGFQDNSGNYQTLKWTGYLSEKPRRRTLESLLYCGFEGEDLEALKIGSVGRSLDCDREVEIVIGHETSDRGTFARVQWVNQVGKVVAKPTTSSMEFVKKLNLNADLAALRKELGESAPPPAFDDEESLPF